MTDAASSPVGQDVSPTPPPANMPNPGSNIPAPSDPNAVTTSGPGPKFNMSQGWWITVGVVTAMILGNVPVLGPLLFGILGLALLYQISQLVQGQ